MKKNEKKSVENKKEYATKGDVQEIVAEALGEIKGLFGGVNNQFIDLGKQVGYLGSQVIELRSDVDIISLHLNGAVEDIKYIKKDIQDIKVELKEVKSDMADMKEDMNSKATKQDILDLHDRFVPYHAFDTLSLRVLKLEENT